MKLTLQRQDTIYELQVVDWSPPRIEFICPQIPLPVLAMIFTGAATLQLDIATFYNCHLRDFAFESNLNCSCDCVIQEKVEKKADWKKEGF